MNPDSERLLEAVGSNSEITIDLETQSNESNMDDKLPSSRIVCASFTTDNETIVIPGSHPIRDHDPLSYVFDTILQKGLRVIGHNVKFDVRWILSVYGLDLAPLIYWDTMVAAGIEDENRSLSLKSLAQKELGAEKWDTVDLRDAESLPWNDLSTYASLDTYFTHELFENQRRRLRMDPPRARLFWYVPMPALRELVHVEDHGIALDTATVEMRKKESQEEMAKAEEALEEYIPNEYFYERDIPSLVTLPERPEVSWQPTSSFFKSYAADNWPVLAYTDKGEPSWDAAVLHRLALMGYEDASWLLSYRDHAKRLSSFLEPWPQMQTRKGRIHATYKVTGTVTGRLSCADPNLQQVSSSLKHCFVAPPGRKFLQADYSQLEVRVAAHESGDENLIQIYRDGRDVYRETAARINSTTPDQITKEQRKHAKPVVLGFLYGMGHRKFTDYARDTFGVSYTEDEAKEVRRIFLEELFPGLSVWHERQRRWVREFGYIMSSIGRVRHLPEVFTHDHAKRAVAERQAINAPVQSLGSDIMMLALSHAQDFTKADDNSIVGTVHDSMLVEADEGSVSQVSNGIAHAMLSARSCEALGFELTVPLEVEIEAGDCWNDPNANVTTYTQTKI